jgi:Zn finger protein HypA/HybF involved in hydrogenase expression
MSDALDRVRARAAAHTAAAAPFTPAAQAPVQPPAAPVAPPQDAVDVNTALGDLQQAMSDLEDRVGVLEQAAVDDAMSEMDTWAGQDPMMAAVAALDPHAASVSCALCGDSGTIRDGNVTCPDCKGAHTAATFNTAQRDAMAKQGIAMDDGSFPIRNQADLENAVQSMGRAANPDAVKAHILKRAEALNLMGWVKEHAPSIMGMANA